MSGAYKFEVTTSTGSCWRCRTVSERGNFVVLDAGDHDETKLNVNTVEKIEAYKGSGGVGLLIAGLVVAAIVSS